MYIHACGVTHDACGVTPCTYNACGVAHVHTCMSCDSMYIHACGVGLDKFFFFWPIIPFDYSCKCCPLFLLVMYLY